MIDIPPPLTQAPAPHGFWRDLRLLVVTERRLLLNKLRQWPWHMWLLIGLPALGLLTLLFGLGKTAYGALGALPPEAGQGFLSLVFLIGLACSAFFGVAAAFAALYMSEDLELLFVAPISTHAVFAVKTLKVAFGNLFGISFFVFLPGLFFGLLFKATLGYYLWLALVTLALLVLGTGLAEILNLLIMRMVPPHRSKEAVGFIGALSGILIAIIFQIPNLILTSNTGLDLGQWLAEKSLSLKVMNWFPWGWGSMALSESIQGRHLHSVLWLLPVLAAAAGVFIPALLLVERGFRRGWISLSQGEGARKNSRARKPTAHGRQPAPDLVWAKDEAPSSPLNGMWAVAKKDLLTIKRDTREWFGYITPLLLMAFFTTRYLFFPGPGAKESLVIILLMYTVMFSGNMALQSFGREGESEWVLNSVPLAGWPVVWGKLLAAVLPTVVLMELLLTGAAIALGLPGQIVAAMAVGGVMISLGASSVGLYYSIHNCRYNPDNPQQKVSFGGAFMMFLVNGLFTGLLALCLIYTFPPPPLFALAGLLSPVRLSWWFPDILLWLAYWLSRPLLWAPALRIPFGLLVTLGAWTAVFFSFMAATVRQSRKGFQVQLTTSFKGTRNKRKALSSR